MFWEALGELYASRTVIPGFETAQGTEVVLWLLSSTGRRPLKDLYHSSRFSEPTVRASLMRLVDQGFATVEGKADDQRQRSARPSQKLLDALVVYRAVLLKVANAANTDSDSPQGLFQEPAVLPIIDLRRGSAAELVDQI